MLHVSHAKPMAPLRIKLPHSSTRDRVPEVYVSIIGAIKPTMFGGASFEAFKGKLHRPGATLDVDALPRPCVAIERVGYVGAYQRGRRRECCYILWGFDFSRYEWVEIVRATTLDQSWTAIFREPAIAALHPRPELVEVTGRSYDLADDLMKVIEEKLCCERKDVQRLTLGTIYERVAGRLVDCA